VKTLRTRAEICFLIIMTAVEKPWLQVKPVRIHSPREVRRATPSSSQQTTQTDKERLQSRRG